MRVLKLLLTSSYPNSSKNSSYIKKQKYYNGHKVLIRNIHFNILQPSKTSITAMTNVKDTIRILFKSIVPLAKKVAAPTPKNTWDEAIQRSAQYFL